MPGRGRWEKGVAVEWRHRGKRGVEAQVGGSPFGKEGFKGLREIQGGEGKAALGGGGVGSSTIGDNEEGGTPGGGYCIPVRGCCVKGGDGVLMAGGGAAKALILNRG